MEQCKMCKNNKNKIMVLYEPEFSNITVPNCFLEYYDENLDTCLCGNYEKT